MTEYRGFKYWQVGAGLWRIQFPGGHKTPPLRHTEAEVKEAIDNIIAGATSGS